MPASVAPAEYIDLLVLQLAENGRPAPTLFRCETVLFHSPHFGPAARCNEFAYVENITRTFFARQVRRVRGCVGLTVS